MQIARVVEHIVEQLGAQGVTHIFGVDGANIEDLFDAACFRCGPAIGVLAATSGGGCLNLFAGLGESLASRVPVLALVGQAPMTADGLGSFQDTSGRNGALDAEALFGHDPRCAAGGDRRGPPRRTSSIAAAQGYSAIPHPIPRR